MESQRSLRLGDANAFFTFDEEPSKEITCAICFEPWQHAVELQPCGHIFCESCLPPPSQSASREKQRCPTCRRVINSYVQPNRALTNLVASLRVSCTRCEWKGEYAQFQRHDCPAGNEHKLPPHETRNIASSRMVDNALQNTTPNAPLMYSDNEVRQPLLGDAVAAVARTTEMERANPWQINYQPEAPEAVAPPRGTLSYDGTSERTPPPPAAAAPVHVEVAERGGRGELVSPVADYSAQQHLSSMGISSDRSKKSKCTVPKCLGISCAIVVLIGVAIIIAGIVTAFDDDDHHHKKDEDGSHNRTSPPTPTPNHFQRLVCDAVVCHNPPKHNPNCTAGSPTTSNASMFECTSDDHGQDGDGNRCGPTTFIPNCTAVCNRVTCRSDWTKCPPAACAMFKTVPQCVSHRTKPFRCYSGRTKGTCSDAPDISYCDAICDTRSCD